MRLRDHLERVVEGLPEGASVMFSAATLRAWLEEDAEETAAGLDDGELLTVSELASRYDRSESTVRGWLTGGKLDGFKVAGSWRVPADAVQRFESDEDDDPALGSGQPVDLSRWRKMEETS